MAKSSDSITMLSLEGGLGSGVSFKTALKRFICIKSLYLPYPTIFKTLLPMVPFTKISYL